jgi:diguanylate cyclase (GGDEF)-like protein/PAS domain S-box-containing protein
MPKERNRRPAEEVLRLVLSAALVMAAFLIHSSLAVLYGIELPPFLLFIAAVLAAAVYGGLGPGLVATALSTVIAGVWLLPQLSSSRAQTFSNTVGLFVFVCMSAIITFVAERRRVALRRSTQLKQEQALEDLRATLESALESLPDGVAIVESGDEFIRFNRAFAAIRGVEDRRRMRLEELAEHQEILSPQGKEIIRQMWPWRRALRGESGENVEYAIRRKESGETWTASSNFYPIRDKNGAIWGAVWTTRDLGPRKSLENDLRASEKRYRALFGLNFDAIAIVRRDGGQVKEVSRAYCEMMGCIAEEVVGRTFAALGIWTDEKDRDAMLETVDRDGICRNFQARLKRKNGLEFRAAIAAAEIELEGEAFLLILVRDVSEIRRAEEQIESLANFDALTGLPNRRMLVDQLRKPPRSVRAARLKRGLLAVDIDGFKKFNDMLGFAAGDRLLQMIAHQLAQSLRKVDTVTRVGGDEFMVLVEEMSETREAATLEGEAIARKILTAVEQPLKMDGVERFVTCSIGVNIFDRKMETPDSALQQAEIALYLAKSAGGNTVRFFAPDLESEVKARASVETELRASVKENQFVLYFQPQMEDNRVIGAEALLRWNHPVRGVLGPVEFIEIAEETGLIVPIGKWVLSTAFKQVAAWADDVLMSKLHLAVNVSAVQMRRPEFVDDVIDFLYSCGPDARRLRLEITESTLLENIEEVIEKMTVLKAHGLSFSLDDFGTGYSSLSYLKRLPLGQLKIDRTFTRDILVDEGSAAIAQAIISISHAMHLPVVAEGVETEAQRMRLEEMGCSQIQGYLVSKPVPLEEFERFVVTVAERRANSTVS